MRRTPPILKSLIQDPEYIGKVMSKKTLYYVFQTGKYYLVFSYRDSTYRKGNFNVVSMETTERIYKIFRGKKKLTRREIEAHSGMKRFVADFDVLQALYVMVALRQASIIK